MAPGGILRYAPDELWQELTFVAYHLHWPLAELLDLEHPDRRRFVEQIQRLA